MVTIIFTEDYATKKKGEEWECESQLANTLVREIKVAKYKEAKKTAEPATKSK